MGAMPEARRPPGGIRGLDPPGVGLLFGQNNVDQHYGWKVLWIHANR